jgi:hypothetical protein
MLNIASGRRATIELAISARPDAERIGCAEWLVFIVRPI